MFVLCIFFVFSRACIDIGFPSNCSFHGICAFDQRTGQTKCVCDNGFQGETCNETNFITTTEPPIVTATRYTETRKKTFDCLDNNGKIPCNGHGECLEYKEQGLAGMYYCFCNEKYFGQYCEQQYKSKWTAFFLEFFVGWVGAERFYLGYTLAGVLQLFFCLIGCGGASFFGASRSSSGNINGCQGIMMIFVIVLFFASLFWWLSDWISILSGSLKDAYGNPLD